MKAYQYFHLSSGYIAKVSDNDKFDEKIIETIRTSLPSDPYQIQRYFFLQIRLSNQV